MGERRIAIDLEIGGENLFTNHLAESLTTGLHAVTFEAVAEDFMKEDTAGLATHQRRTREGICNRSFGQRLETAPDIFGIANHDVLTGQRIERSGIVGLVKGQLHTVVGLDLGLNEDAIADAVLYDGSTLGAHEMRSLILHLEVSNSLSELWPLTEDGTDAAKTLFPFALFGRGEGGMGEGRLIIGLGSRTAEHTKARGFVLVVGLRAEAVLCIAISGSGAVVGGEHLRPDCNAQSIGRSVSQRKRLGATARLVVELEVIELGGTDTYLRRERAGVILIGDAEETERSCDARVE